MPSLWVTLSLFLVRQSSYLSNSDKDCDWLILERFIREQMHDDATFLRLENKFWFENTKLNVWGNKCTLNQKTNKEASAVLCSVWKHLGSGRALEVEKNTRLLKFPLYWHFFHSTRLPACFTTEQNTVEASSFAKRSLQKRLPETMQNKYNEENTSCTAFNFFATKSTFKHYKKTVFPQFLIALSNLFCWASQSKKWR